MSDQPDRAQQSTLDELLEMQKDAFKVFLFVTWLISLVIIWIILFLNLTSLAAGLGQAAVWIGVSPLNLGMHWLARRRFRLATWIWMCASVGLLALFIPWRAAPDLGPLPYGYILTVIVSALLISRNATLYMAGLSTALSLAGLYTAGALFEPRAGTIAAPLVMTWVAAMLSWVSSDQLVTALQWTRSSQLEAYTQAERLRQSRDALEKSLLIRDNLNAQLQEAHQQVTRRAIQLETAAKVSRRITALLDLEQLLTEVTNLICGQFGYYYAGVFLIDEKEGELVLRAAGGERGPAVWEQGLRLAIDQTSLNGYAASTGQTQCINDVSMTPQYRRHPLLSETISELVIPLYIGQNIVGTLDVQSVQINAFTPDDVAALEGLAAQAAIAIQNTRLYESEQARRRIAETLRQVGHILSSTLDLDRVLDLFLEQLALVVPYSRAAVMLQSGDILSTAASRGFGDAQRALEIKVDIRENDVFSQISRSRQALIIPDVEQVEGWKQLPWLPLDHAWMGAPLIAGDQVIGMLSLTRRERDAFGQDEENTVSTFANQAAIAIQNARLYDEVKRFNQELEQRVRERTAELQKAYETLEHLDRNKSDYINITAHELRTPLTVVQGYAAMLRSNQALAADASVYPLLDGVLKGMGRLHEIVNRMLDVARIDSQALDLHPEPLRIAELANKIRAELGPALTERNLRMRLDNLENLPPVNADPEMLYKALYNVVVNAVKYTPDGGAITLGGQSIPNDALGDCVEITVSDTGIGIDPEHHELIFEKLYTVGKVALHSSGKTSFKGGGPGLGLAIARGIVQAHNGRIWVTSPGCDEEKCPGSVFHLLLPVAGVKGRKILR